MTKVKGQRDGRVPVSRPFRSPLSDGKKKNSTPRRSPIHCHAPLIGAPVFDFPAQLISPLFIEEKNSQSVQRLIRPRNVGHGVDIRRYQSSAHCHDRAIRTGHAPGGCEKAHFNIRVPPEDVRNPVEA